MYSRGTMVSLARSWVGKNERDGSHKMIIDIYNSLTKKPRGIKMQYNWAWCACTWSALAIKLGYTAIIPIEISCGYLIEEAKKMGCWQEKDNYIPSPGDAILYDWDDSGKGDNTGWPDHIGIIEQVNESSGYFVVIEGNYQDEVKRRTVSINGKYIRGFITPNYDKEEDFSYGDKANLPIETVAREVIAGSWGNGEERRKRLEAAGYDPDLVQREVNCFLNGDAYIPSQSIPDQNQPVEKQITASCDATSYSKSISGSYRTTANLHLRNDAGTNKKSLLLIPAGTVVHNYGYYSTFNGADWYYIQVKVDGILYTGFSHSYYLEKAA